MAVSFQTAGTRSTFSIRYSPTLIDFCLSILTLLPQIIDDFRELGKLLKDKCSLTNWETEIQFSKERAC